MGYFAKLIRDDKKFIGDAVIISTGSEPGYFVMDVDNQHAGIPTYKRFNNIFGPFTTPTAKTPHNGLHIYFYK